MFLRPDFHRAAVVIGVSLLQLLADRQPHQHAAAVAADSTLSHCFKSVDERRPSGGRQDIINIKRKKNQAYQ